MIYYLMGKSASGKDSIYKELLQRRPEWKEVILYTTRPIRDGETEGVEYHFVDDATIDRFEREGRVIECRTYNTVYGPWRYATIDDGQIETKLKPDSASLPDQDYLMIGTLESYLKTRDYFGRDMVMPLYIEVPDDIRMERAKKRELLQKVPKLAEMKRRFEADQKDFSEEKLEAGGIGIRYLNLDMESCIHEILKDTR